MSTNLAGQSTLASSAAFHERLWRLPESMQASARNLFVVAALGALIAFVPAVAAVAVAKVLFHADFSYGKNLFAGRGVAAIVFAYVFFSPIVETAIMAAVAWGVGKVVSNKWVVTLIAALALAALHAATALAWAAIVLWPFIVFSFLYVAWRRCGKGKAYAVATLAHMIYNAIAVGIVIYAVRM